MLTVLAGVAQFEREIMLERQQEGVTKAKAQGKYKGRKPISLNLQQEVIQLVASVLQSNHYATARNRRSHSV